MDPETGGPCQGIRNLIPELSRNGISSEVVCLDNPEAAFLKLDQFPVYALGSYRTPWKYHPKLYSWLLNHLPQYEIILVRGLWLYHSYAVTKAIRELKSRDHNHIPRVYILPHGMLDPWFQQSNKRRFKAIRNNIYWHLIEKRVIREADGMLFTCESELQLAKKSFKGYCPQSELNIGYGIQYPPVYTDKMQHDFLRNVKELGGDSYLLFLGRLDEKKGVDLLIEAYRILLDKSVKLPKLIIAGPGIETAYGQRLLNVVNAFSGLKNNVLFTGMLTGDAKWGALYSCEAFILPSHQENFGIAVVEAMACSKPVLITNQVNIHKEIKSAGAGLICYDNLQGVVQILSDFFQMSQDEKNRVAVQARNLFENSYTIKASAKKMIETLGL